MPKTNTQEERQLIKLVEQLPLQEEEKSSWAERIRKGEMSTDLAEEIRTKLSTPSDGENDDRAQANRNRYLAELAMLIKRWRLSSQSHNFNRK
jgi:hypothetical protein